MMCSVHFKNEQVDCLHPSIPSASYTPSTHSKFCCHAGQCSGSSRYAISYFAFQVLHYWMEGAITASVWNCFCSPWQPAACCESRPSSWSSTAAFDEADFAQADCNSVHGHAYCVSSTDSASTIAPASCFGNSAFVPGSRPNC